MTRAEYQDPQTSAMVCVMATTWFTTFQSLRACKPDWEAIACYREPIAHFIARVYPRLPADLTCLALAPAWAPALAPARPRRDPAPAAALALAPALGPWALYMRVPGPYYALVWPYPFLRYHISLSWAAAFAGL